MKKAIRLAGLFFAITVVIVIAGALYFFVPNPFKITDPFRHGFNPDQFRFEDHMPSICTEKEVIAKLFPVGTKKEFVDRVLIKAGGAKIRKSANYNNKYNYVYKPLHWSYWLFGHTWNIAFFYNDQDRVVNITFPTDGKEQSAYTYYQDCTMKKNYGDQWK